MRLALVAASVLTSVFVLSAGRPAAVAGKPPTAVTGSASALGLDAVTVNGGVHSNSQPTTAGRGR